jgi:GrpB-like predicted nucleotidyltransferase (UPF0157 family)
MNAEIQICRLGEKEMTLDELWRLFPVVLAEHNPDWRDWYEEEKSALRSILGNVLERIDHIGSTSIDGLIAKPIVDILLQIDSGCDPEWLKSVLVNNGWLLMAEQTAPEPDFRQDWNKGYLPTGFAEKVFHLHIRYTGDWDEIYFRDYLADHPKAAAEYAVLKQRLLVEYKYNRDAYTEAKGEFISICTAKARQNMKPHTT